MTSDLTIKLALSWGLKPNLMRTARCMRVSSLKVEVCSCFSSSEIRSCANRVYKKKYSELRNEQRGKVPIFSVLIFSDRNVEF